MNSDGARSFPAKHIPTWTLADRMRKARIDAGLSVDEICEVIGITRKSVYNYEGGATRPLLPILRAWADVTGTWEQWLTDGIDPTRPQPSVSPLRVVTDSSHDLPTMCPQQDSNLQPTDYKSVRVGHMRSVSYTERYCQKASRVVRTFSPHNCSITGESRWIWKPMHNDCSHCGSDPCSP